MDRDPNSEASRAAHRASARTRATSAGAASAYCPVEGDPRRRQAAPRSSRRSASACGLCVAECGRRGHVVRDDTPACARLLRVAPSGGRAARERVHRGAAPDDRDAGGARARDARVLRGRDHAARRGDRRRGVRDSSTRARTACLSDALDLSGVGGLRAQVPPCARARARADRAAVRRAGPTDPERVSRGRGDRVRQPVLRAQRRVRSIPQFDGAVDAAIDFIELDAADRGVERDRGRRDARPPRPTGARALKEVSLTDGFPRQTLVSRDMTDASVARRPRTRRRWTACSGRSCAGEAARRSSTCSTARAASTGPRSTRASRVFAKRNVEAQPREQPGATHVSTRALLRVLPAVDAGAVVRGRPRRVYGSRRRGDRRGAARRRASTRETRAIDCGACG